MDKHRYRDAEKLLNHGVYAFNQLVADICAKANSLNPDDKKEGDELMAYFWEIVPKVRNERIELMSTFLKKIKKEKLRYFGFYLYNYEIFEELRKIIGDIPELNEVFEIIKELNIPWLMTSEEIIKHIEEHLNPIREAMAQMVIIEAELLGCTDIRITTNSYFLGITLRNKKRSTSQSAWI